MERVAGTEWEMPVVLGGLYSMRCSEVLGLRWQNVDLKSGTFDVVEQLPFHMPPKTTIIEEMAPPKSNGRRLPITDVARPFFEKVVQATQKKAAEQAGRIMTTTLLGQKRMARHKLLTGFPPVLASCWPGWICHTYATTIYDIVQPQTCINSPATFIPWVKC